MDFPINWILSARSLGPFLACEVYSSPFLKHLTLQISVPSPQQLACLYCICAQFEQICEMCSRKVSAALVEVFNFTLRYSCARNT